VQRIHGGYIKLPSQLLAEQYHHPPFTNSNTVEVKKHPG
jgi:hypothetical protein